MFDGVLEAQEQEALRRLLLLATPPPNRSLDPPREPIGARTKERHRLTALVGRNKAARVPGGRNRARLPPGGAVRLPDLYLCSKGLTPR
jgi:hypothetical protein